MLIAIRVMAHHSVDEATIAASTVMSTWTMKLDPFAVVLPVDADAVFGL